jgi:hypothetical protein
MRALESFWGASLTSQDANSVPYRTTVAGIGDAGRGFAGITDPGYNSSAVRREREIKRWKSSR